jgi:hypothetical protein
MLRAIPLMFFVVLTACMGAVGPNPNPGDDDDDPGPTESARELYVNNVHPIMARCNGAGCHAVDATASGALGKYYSADSGATYTAIKQATSIVGDYSSISPILTKIDAGHQAISYSSTERSDIIDWLAAELTEQQQDPTAPPPVDPAELLRSFSACMTQANFEAANMPNLMGNAAAQNGQACKNCHTGGAFGFVADNNATLYFTTLSSSMSQMVKYFGVTGGQIVVAPGAMNNAGTAIVAHPPFTAEGLPGYAAITQFYDLTKAAVTAGNCGPPKAVNP